MTARPRPVRLRTQIVMFALARTVINTGYRMVYPFLPTFARGLGVDVTAIAQAITARSSLGLLGPLFGTVADNRGRRFAMLFGLLLLIVGLLLPAIGPVYASFFAAMLLIGSGKIIFDSAVQAYAGDRVHYTQRGLAIGVIEIGWSASFLLGIPLAGWLIARGGDSTLFPWETPWLTGIPAAGWVIDRAGWNRPYLFLAIAVAVIALVVWRLVPEDRPLPGARPPLIRSIRRVFAKRAAVAGLLLSLLISAGNEVVAIVFGLWMENSFGLQIAALGAASMVIGVAELGGEGLVAGLADRLGKRRATALGIAGSGLAALLLPLLAGNLAGGLAGLFLLFITFEFTLVTAIALISEIEPEARATLMAGNVAFQSMGRALGAPLGTALFTAGLAGGIAPNSLAAALLNVAALILLLLFIQKDE